MILMSKLNTTKIVIVLLVSIWLFGCSSVPENELTDIDNVITEKQKKAARTEAKAAEQAKAAQPSGTKTTKLSDKPIYPLIPAAPVMRPIAVPNPIVATKTPTPDELAEEDPK